MCVRNLNSYGCGHEYKEISPCGRNCEPDFGYKFIRGYDCSQCKSSGTLVTRGRDGQGRYAQSIERRETKEEQQSVTGPVIDEDGGVSAWSNTPVQRLGQKSWHKGSRKAADRAWEKEHDSRIEDLCARTETMSFRSDSTSRPVPASQAYRRSPSPVEVYSSTDEDRHSQRSRSSRRPLYGETMSVADIVGSISSRRHRYPKSTFDSYPRSHYESQDSLDSMPRVTSGHRTRKHDNYYDRDSAYGSHSSHRSHTSYTTPRSRYGARSITYPEPSSPPSQLYQMSVSGSPYGYPHAHYGMDRMPINLPRYSTY
jgi:hypothetical protein